jgi:hypothetical protein
MATNDLQKRIAIGLMGVAFVAVAAILYFGLRPQPQMGASEETFKTVDALYTAIRSENPARVESCEARLSEQNAAGKLPDRAWKTLRAIIERAKAGGWRPAAESLYEFMRGQRRGV